MTSAWRECVTTLAATEKSLMSKRYAARMELTTGHPNKGSHAKVSDPSQAEILTIPFARPIKPVYIRRLVRLVDAVLTARALRANQDAPIAKDRKT